MTDSPPARRSPRPLLILGALLVLPALLVNLGEQSLIGDEGIRSLVAFEMLESGDFIQPTLNGENYYKKPPLYNWILAAVFTLAGRADECCCEGAALTFSQCDLGSGSRRRITIDEADGSRVPRRQAPDVIDGIGNSHERHGERSRYGDRCL